MGSTLAFQPSLYPTLGIELELHLLDSETFDLVDGILPLLDGYPVDPHIKPEFSQTTVEITSAVCTNIPELEADIRLRLSRVQARCHRLGMLLCGAGTHPFCTRQMTVTPTPRFLAHQKASGYLACPLMTCAFHIHVGMPSGDTAIAVMGKLKPYLPILIALSASSPFWQGQDTHYTCYRQRILSSLRTYGIPPTFPTWQAFSDFFAVAQRAEIFNLIRDIHWDLRPRHDLGTLEIRVMDAQPTLQESILLSAFVHCLVVYLQTRCDDQQRGFRLEPQPWLIEKENYYRATRLGLKAQYIEDKQGNSRSIHEILKDILGSLTDTATELGESDYLQLLQERLQIGPSYHRQRQIFRETNSLKLVTAVLVRELADNKMLTSTNGSLQD
jgi:carboxylate-amine ligase